MGTGMPRLARGALLSLGVIALMACGKSTDEMPRPVYIWEGLDGSCGYRLAVDGGGVLWRSRECSDVPKYQRVRALDETEASAVAFAFHAVEVEPATARNPCADRGAGIQHVFTVLEADGRTVERRACAMGERDDPTGLPGVYERAARSFPR
jgi:hypothetical protein